ncbi:hypothetical protein RirG_042970 [Rhizophagus irregularis DAOM 197198w]|uniref:HTH CENPB-type domain-containing protein n=1 Tax=Rhizophagus irregularis (strain DAOM 197198w) TaxID=1432141 RepID=A0A015K6V1_RHIIW|nr:hypothetical protein RirG_042970 [Rhizophagus irregularis DAOM 197198w]
MPLQKKRRQNMVVSKRVANKKIIKRHRNSYSIEQKRQVVAYAKENGIIKASKSFELDKSMVSRWVNLNEKWVNETNQNSKRVGSGRKSFYPEAEKELYDWIIEQRKQGLGVTYAIARVKMLDILKKPTMISLYGNSINEFKTSNRWISAFMKRHNLSWRRRTKVSQKLPSQTNELLKNFQEFVTRLRTEKLFEMSNILNMDETPVWFDMTGNFTIDNRGEKTIHIRGTGNEKNRFTVVLTVSADGTKFPPICIFKGKRLSHGEQIPSGVIVWFQQNGWMDSELMKDYVDYVNSNLGKMGISNAPTMMVYDSFRGHLEESVKIKFRDRGIDLAVIPGGLTSICQPLDVSINKPFKDNLRKEWHIWMAGGGSGMTASGNFRRARLSDVCGWVKRAWDRISDEIVIESFKTCRISTSLDGTDDEITDNESSDDDIIE